MLVLSNGVEVSVMGMSRKIKINLFIGFFMTALMALLSFIEFPPMETLEEYLYDYRFKIRGTVTPPENIVIAAIDEKSLGSLGRWPWNRDKIAQLVKRLFEEGAEIIVFDIFFFEKEKNDRVLGHAMRRAGNVLLPIVFDFKESSSLPESETLIQSAFTSIVHPERFHQYSPITAKRILIPIPELMRETMALGHINMLPDRDGTLRWETMAVEYQGYLYPSIDLQASAIYLGIPHEKIILRATEEINLGEKRTIPTDRYGRSLIYYYGPWQTFKHFSISDILEGQLKPGELQGKIVLIGASAVGIYDLRVTPFSAAMPGVEKHASVIASIMENRFLKRAPFSINLILLLVSGFLFSFLIIRLMSFGATLITGLFMLLIFGSGYFLFVHQGLWINIAYPSINILLIFVMAMVYNYGIEERTARKIRAMFSTYATEKVVNELIKNPNLAKLGGERREMSILFSDVVGFTTFSEKHTPEEVVAMLNEYLGAMTDVIFRWEGTLDKFVGDAIVAFWGAPMRQENHAELALRCALEMVKRLEGLQKKWQSEGKPVLDSGIGINTGEVLVGNIGAEGKKMEYTVIGDHVNLCSRVESLTRQFKARILITEYTLNKIRNLVNIHFIGHLSIEGKEKVSVKGREEKVGIYEVHSIDHGLESKIQELEKKETKS
jgi:adenylate cyclase